MKVYKTSVIVFIMLFCNSLIFAQSSDNQEIDKTKLNIELDLVQPIFGGIGGTIGIEKKHLSVYVMGFGTKLTEDNRDIVLKGAEGLDVYNWGVELGADYYLKASHRGLFVGGLVSYDGYQLTNEANHKETVLAWYIVPRVGYRLVLPKKLSAFYLQPALALPLRFSDNSDSYTAQQVEVSDVLVLPMLTFGVRINL